MALRDLALSYAARYASTGARLEAYLARKLKERGVAEDGDGRSMQIDIPALVGRLVELGYVDDAAYARMRTRDLAGRGYGARRVEQALWAAGVDETIRADTAPDEAAQRRAAVLMAKKRGFGPYRRAAAEEGDPLAVHKAREKAVAAMLRAGHDYDHVRFLLDCPGEAELEAWLDEVADQEGFEGSW
ncbi:regulatory protein RecX [Erythrobacter dokdonensis]|uniref:Regulatory protein RecX n=1 Tax=Erythrobacter dokdonensis DSW-74 TaxID=1300349 RepID=A0A1A7BEV6_9SPHN|nr:regulatory protein RecX [Erythrobacter dokdonensis]MEE4317723.1 regulatory protein RecX [Erythrobacter sp.]OBV10286.1 regulatory protein RecX [Erythrobacter dokdonensis DSW-74]